MKTRSAKAKGRRLVARLRDLLMKGFPMLEDGDLIIQPTSVTGEDLRLSPLARRVLPFSFEAKNTEKIAIWAALKQAATNAPAGTDPVVVFSRNNAPVYVAMHVDLFIRLAATRAI
jgi:hypothetical protein